MVAIFVPLHTGKNGNREGKARVCTSSGEPVATHYWSVRPRRIVNLKMNGMSPIFKARKSMANSQLT